MNSNSKRKNDDLIEIDFSELFALLLHKSWILLLSMIGAGVLGFVLSAFVLPEKYESTTSIYIQTKDSGNAITYSDAQLASQLTKDYEKLITGRYVLEKVIEQNDLDTDYEHFLKQVSIVNETDTRIIEITVKDKDPYVAQKLADAIREVAADHIKEVTDVEAVNVANVANLASEAAEPSILLWTVVMVALGLLVSMIIVIVRFFMDDTIKTAEDVEKYLELSTLALIPKGTYTETSSKSTGSSRGKNSNNTVKKTREIQEFTETSLDTAKNELDMVVLSVDELDNR